MIVPVYRGIDVIATITSDSIIHSQKVMQEDIITISFDHYQMISFSIGDYITVDGYDYSINTLPVVNKQSTNKYSFTVVFEGIMYELGKVQYMLTGQGEFDLTANAETFIELLVTNMNRIQSGWAVGAVDMTDYKNFHFSCENCLSVIQKLAALDGFNTEFYIGGSNDKEIYFTTFGADNGLTFQYGKGKGLYNINRETISSTNIVTRLYAFGAAKNIPYSYRDSEYSSQRLMFADSSGNHYIEKNTSIYGTIEYSKNFDDIYPRRTGTISWVNTSDTTIFKDSGMDFDLNSYLLSGITAKVHFQTGQLAGYEIEIAEGGYDNATKQYTLKPYDNGVGGWLPSDALKPAVGDKYVLEDIEMPQSYIDDAEDELLTVASVYLDQNSVPKVKYAVECDPIHFNTVSIEILIGDYSTIVDTDLGLNRLIRMVTLEQNIALPQEIKIELADTIAPVVISRLYADNLETQRTIKKTGLDKTPKSIIDISAIIKASKSITNNFVNIVGGLLSANVLQVGNEGSGGAIAALDGTDNADDAVVIFAGASLENKEIAPFRIHKNGTLIAAEGTDYTFLRHLRLDLSKVILETYKNSAWRRQIELKISDLGYGITGAEIDVEIFNNSGVSQGFWRYTANGIYDGVNNQGVYTNGNDLGITAPSGNIVLTDPLVLNYWTSLPASPVPGMTGVYRSGTTYRLYSYLNGGWRYVPLT